MAKKTATNENTVKNTRVTIQEMINNAEKEIREVPYLGKCTIAKIDGKEILLNSFSLVYFINCEKSNPNGSITTNEPQTVSSGMGLISAVSQNHKTRCYAEVAHGVNNYIISGPDLTSKQRAAEGDTNADTVKNLEDTHWDIRCFGAAYANLSSKKNKKGDDAEMYNTHGCIAVQDATTDIPLVIEEIGQTRCVANDDKGKGKGIVGSRYMVDFAVYRGFAIYTPVYAIKNGFTVDDVIIFIDSLRNMYSTDTCAARSGLKVVDMYAFVCDGFLSRNNDLYCTRKYLTTEYPENPEVNFRNYDDMKIVLHEDIVPETVNVKHTSVWD